MLSMTSSGILVIYFIVLFAVCLEDAADSTVGALKYVKWAYDFKTTSYMCIHYILFPFIAFHSQFIRI